MKDKYQIGDLVHYNGDKMEPPDFGIVVENRECLGSTHAGRPYTYIKIVIWWVGDQKTITYSKSYLVNKLHLFEIIA